MITCPFCESLSTIPIVYGKPTPELERAAARGLVQIAGCVVSDKDPTFRCLECDCSWRAVSAESCVQAESDALLAEAAQIFGQYLFPVYAGMISSAIFSESTEDWGSIYAYLRLKEIFGITRGCERSQVDAVRRFRESNPERFNQLMNELKQQVAVLTLTRRWSDGLFGPTFTAAALVFNASPMAHDQTDSDSLDRFENNILRGWIGFE